MAIASQRFCINRKIAPSLSIEAFFRLVNSLGLNKVELRNDLPSGKVTDDLSHQQVRSWLTATILRSSLSMRSTPSTAAPQRFVA
jgi:predicted xylose isomerase-like sugar epimerase